MRLFVDYIRQEPVGSAIRQVTYHCGKSQCQRGTSRKNIATCWGAWPQKPGIRLASRQPCRRWNVAIWLCWYVKGPIKTGWLLILCMHCFFHIQPPDFSSGGCIEHAHNRIAYGCPGRISIHMSRTEHDTLRYLRKLTCGEPIYEIHIDGGVQKTQAHIAVFDRSVSILAENNSTAGIFL